MWTCDIQSMHRVVTTPEEALLNFGQEGYLWQTLKLRASKKVEMQVSLGDPRSQIHVYVHHV